MKGAVADKVPAEALELHESTVAAPTEDRENEGKVLIHVIRPGIGKGRGKHLYEASMLRENAEKFSGWPMYIDHLSPEARKAAGGLPRSLRDVGGWIEEAWWDDTVPADPEAGYDAGAVVARVTPFGLAEALVQRAPHIIQASISAHATGVRRTTKNGQAVWLVEGIQDRGSVDWVTEAGAGGRVVSLMEALHEEIADRPDGVKLLESLDDDSFIEYLERERPHLREALASEHHPADEGGDDEMTPEQLREALQSEDARTLIEGMIDERLESRVESAVAERVEEAVAEERDLIRAEAEAAADRKVELRDMRDEAHEKIDEAKLPPSWKQGLKARFDLTESGQPTPDLDVIDEVDGDGKVVKSARAILRESIAEAIKDERTKLAEARPTRVTGQGPGKPADGDTPKKDPAEKPEADANAGDDKPYAGTLTESLLQEAGFDTSNDPWAKL